MQSIVQVPARSTPHSSLERACALHRGLCPMTDGSDSAGCPPHCPHTTTMRRDLPQERRMRRSRCGTLRFPANCALSHAFGPCGRETAQTRAGLGPHMESGITAVRRARYHRVLTYLSPAAPSRTSRPPSCRGYRRTPLLNVSLCRG